MTSKIPDYITKEHEKRLNMSIEQNFVAKSMKKA